MTSEEEHSELLNDLPIRAEDIGFTPDEMTACERCGRSNPPNRAACIYCGAQIAGAVVDTSLDFRPLENWESGFNVIVIGAGDPGVAPASAALAKLVGAEKAVVNDILGSTRSLPVARVESQAHADHLLEMLNRFDVAARIIPDSVLMANRSPHRLRAIEFRKDRLRLTLFGGDQTEIEHEDLALIVTGLLFESRTEAVQKRKRGATRTLSESQTSSDSRVVDIYSRSDSVGWRIASHGFDFSCVGEARSLLASENITRLVEKLAEISPQIRVVDDFLADAPLLEHCWPGESRHDALGFQRSGFARKDLSRVSITTNASQFTKYSRLQWHLL